MDACRTELCAAARWRESLAGCDRALLLRVFAGARARTPARGTRLRAPARRPVRAAARPARRGRRNRYRSCRRRRWKKDRPRCGASLLRSGGSHGAWCPCEPPSRSSRQDQDRDRRPRRCRTGKKAGRGISGWRAIPRESLRDRWPGEFSCAWATLPGVPATVPVLPWATARCESPSCSLLYIRLCGRTEDDGAIRRAEIFSGHGLNFVALHGQEAVENRVHQLRLIVEQGEAGEQVHEAVTRHAAAATFERRVIIGAPFHFELVEFVFADALFLDFTDHGVECGERFFAGVFGFVQDSRDHLRRTVVAEDIVAASVGFAGDLLLQHQLAIRTAGAASVQRLIEQCHRAPIGGAALRHGVANGHGRERAGFLFDFTAARSEE